ncbi:MAG: GatB/YqeY domain-containing protein [Desulfobacterales bacterium]
MTLQEQIKKDLMSAMKAKDDVTKDTLRVVMGEFGRLDGKTVSDDDVINILKKLVKSEKETMEKSGDTGDSAYIRIIEGYLPQMASEEDIKTWIKENVDLSEFKNKMQAMKPIMTHFGSAVDGNTVKKILLEM